MSGNYGRVDGDTVATREVLVHVIEEYARHAGHAGLLRECIDGRTGHVRPCVDRCAAANERCPLRNPIGVHLDGLPPHAIAALSAQRHSRAEAPRLSPWITGTAAGDGDVLGIGPDAVWCWASPVLTLSYFERQGPALVDLALFGYFATRLIKPAGLAAIRPNGDGDFPGMEAIDAQAEGLCVAEFEGFVGLSYEESVLYVGLITPSEESWPQGDRSILCSIYDPAGEVSGEPPRRRARFPGGHRETSTDSSVTGSHSHTGSLEKSLPGPAIAQPTTPLRTASST